MSETNALVIPRLDDRCKRYLEMLADVETLRAAAKAADRAFEAACERKTNTEIDLARAINEAGGAVMIGDQVLTASASGFTGGINTVSIHKIVARG